MTAVAPPSAPDRAVHGDAHPGEAGRDEAGRGGAIERASSRDRALTAARDSLLEIGATRTTMVEVARRSKVGRTTLYRHWKDISALFADLLTRELAVAVESLTTEPRDADHVAEAVCDIADELRTDPMLDALRRHESELLAVYLLHRLGTAQRHLISLLRASLEQVIATDHRLAGRDAARMAHMLYLAVQGAVLGAPLADPPLEPDAWRAELDLLVRSYLGL